jgi:CheY-like chemotaxis protein
MAKIIVVDDSKMFRMLASAPLTEAGHTVLEVEPVSLYAVLRAIYEFNPDLILADYFMPNCNGMTLARVIREDPQFHNVKILICSSHSEESLVEQLGTFRINGFIVKGKEMQNLTARIAKQLERTDT